jgi:phage/plasmid-like protein (TIGR03299 family)
MSTDIDQQMRDAKAAEERLTAGRAGWDRAEFGDGEFSSGVFASTVQGQRWETWHGLGTYFEDKPLMTARECMAEVPELDTEIVPCDLAFRHPVTGEWTVISEEVANVRLMDSMWLANVTTSYKRVQPWESFQFMDDLVQSDQAKYIAAIVLSKGRKIVLTVRLTELGIKIAGMTDESIDINVVLSNTYDRSGAFQTAITPIRPACVNSEALTFKTAPRVFSLRHTESITGKIAQAQQTLGLVHTYVAELERVGNLLVEQPFSNADFGRFMDRLVPLTPKMEADPGGRAASNRAEAVMAVTRIFSEADNLANVRNTKWAALNAVTEYEDWVTKVRDTKLNTAEARRFMRSVDDNPQKDRALALLLN